MSSCIRGRDDEINKALSCIINCIAMRFSALFTSRIFRNIVLGCALFAFLFVVFKTGESAGYREANILSRWNFRGPAGRFLHGFSRSASVSAHGAYGPITKIDGSMIVIQGRDKTKKTVVVLPGAVIRRSGGNMTQADLKIGDRIVAIGATNQEGRIEADRKSVV